jgi:hypothetical protein
MKLSALRNGRSQFIIQEDAWDSFLLEDELTKSHTVAERISYLRNWKT